MQFGHTEIGSGQQRERRQARRAVRVNLIDLQPLEPRSKLGQQDLQPLRRQQAGGVLEINGVDMGAIVQFGGLGGVELVSMHGAKGETDSGDHFLEADLLGDAGVLARRGHVRHRIDDPHPRHAMPAEEIKGESQDVFRGQAEGDETPPRRQKAELRVWREAAREIEAVKGILAPVKQRVFLSN